MGREEVAWAPQMYSSVGNALPGCPAGESPPRKKKEGLPSQAPATQAQARAQAQAQARARTQAHAK